ncbi:MAG: sigma-54-dependent transcriptional regulator [Vicinamibacterales bacterium]
MSDTAAAVAPGVARSAAMQGVLSRLGLAIQEPGGVLLCGEPGSGRETFARAIHAGRTAGEKAERPFVVVDCRSAGDLEKRLFGCEAFEGVGPNGLDRVAAGSMLHQAGGGTLLFRHITQMPGPLQDRLVRVLRDREAWLENGNVTSRWAAEIRPIATATDADLGGSVHPELRRRLAQTVIAVPPLRERREDIPSLVRSLIADICRGAELPRKRITRQAVALLKALPWRGNIRELRSLLRTVTLAAKDEVIRLSDVLAQVQLDGSANTFVYGGSLREARERFERDYVAFVLEQHHGRMAEAAKTLGIQRTNLYRKVRQLAVRRGRTGPDSQD